MIDSLVVYCRPLTSARERLPERYALVTLHRPSNVETPKPEEHSAALLEINEDCR